MFSQQNINAIISCYFPNSCDGVPHVLAAEVHHWPGTGSCVRKFQPRYEPDRVQRRPIRWLGFRCQERVDLLFRRQSRCHLQSQEKRRQ